MRPRIALIILATIAVALGLVAALGGEAPRATASADPAAVAAPDPPYFTDRIGGTDKPVFIFSAEDWGVIFNGGLNNNGDWKATYDQYFDRRARQGYNGVEVQMFSSTNMAGGRNGPDWDETNPFTPALDPTTAPNEKFWTRRDYFIAAAARHGFYVFLNASSTLLAQGAFTASWTKPQWEAYGTFLGQRYGSDPNIMWIVGDDYFGNLDDNLTAFLTALRAAGGNQPMSYQAYQEASSRLDIYHPGSTNNAGGIDMWGKAHADYNWGYSYNATYDVVEKMGLENDTMTPIPYMFGDGTFLNTGMTETIDKDFTDKDFARRMIWWALSSGSKGFNLGDNYMWQWDSSALGQITANTFYTRQIPAITRYWRALPGWQRLIADTSGELVTGGRGTHTTAIVSGGSGTQLTDNSDSYVTAARTPDGSLAVIYMTHPSTITINQSMMVAGYKATWVDPATGATTPTTPGPTYSSSSRGKNSVGDADWVLVLGPPPSTTPPQPHAVTYQGTAHLTPRSWVKGNRVARLRARFAITYACSACGGVKRPITIQGLRHGSWRALRTTTYQHPTTLRVRVPYMFRQVRVTAPALRTNASTTYARVVSNSVRVPRKPR